MPSINQIRYYVPQLIVPPIGDRAILQIANDPHGEFAPGEMVSTSPVQATFTIPGIGLGVLTKNTLYLPDRRRNDNCE